MNEWEMEMDEQFLAGTYLEIDGGPHISAIY